MGRAGSPIVDPNNVFPFLSSALPLVFFAFPIAPWRERRRPYQAIWALGMLWYAISAGTEWIGAAAGWSEPLYRVWYLFGAIMVAGWLGLGTAYIAGFQGETLGAHSVACMTKHFPGGGPQKAGIDHHFEFQLGPIYTGDHFDYHLIPFEAAFAAGTAAIMPYYGIPVDQTDENVAMAFNKAIITGLLREKYGYDGVVCTDWGLITDTHIAGTIWPARETRLRLPVSRRRTDIPMSPAMARIRSPPPPMDGNWR